RSSVWLPSLLLIRSADFLGLVNGPPLIQFGHWPRSNYWSANGKANPGRSGTEDLDHNAYSSLLISNEILLVQ
ncbi:MAG TPA: hypothetical protein VN843_12955, partial [Anaerolineales bacterium]|nr:hypothetical protein [Anaerolineales bacterium]